MGNAIGKTNKNAKIMKIDGEIYKIKIPATAMDVLKDYPSDYVLLESKVVKRYGIRAPELRPEEELKPGKIYFLINMPKFPEPITTRAKSLPHTSCAKERLESLMSREKSSIVAGSGSGPVRVKMRLPRAEIEKLMEGSKDEAEAVDRIVDFCLQNSSKCGEVGFRD
ncbi:hypothetical protein ACS0TY_029788 [Phlomoides rotata]